MKTSINVEDKEYEVERNDRGSSTVLTIEQFPGIEGTLGYDEHCDHDSPRDWDNVGTMSVSYRGYNLGDEDISEIDFEIECPRCDGHGMYPDHSSDSEIDCQQCDGSGYVTLNPAEYFRKKRGARVVIGLFVYEHSGITMSAGPTIGPVLKKNDIRSTDRFVGDAQGWDTSFVGFIYDTPENVKKCMGEGATDEQIEAALRSEVAIYASYLEGDVTFWNVIDDETSFNEGCGGYIGSSEECEAECFAALENAVEVRINERALRQYWAERDVNTVEG